MKIEIKSSISKYAMLLATCIFIYITILCSAAYLKFIYFKYEDFDLAVHSQSIWNICHGSFDCSILGIPFLGNHMTLILFLIAPFYAIFPSPLLLLYLQTLVIALGSLGIYLLAKRELTQKWASSLAIVYLAYPPLIYMNLYEFHPVAFATSFLAFMIYFYKIDNFKGFLTFMLLSIFCQENISLIIVMFTAYVMLDKRKGRWVWVPFSLGISYFIFTVFFLMPYLNNNIIQFWQMYAHLGSSPLQMAKNTIVNPIHTLQVITHPDKLSFLNALFGPLGYLSFLNPAMLIPAIPVFCQRLLSDRLTETRILFHYQAELIPFIFISAIYGIKQLLSRKHLLLRIAPVILLIIFPAAAMLSSDIVGQISRLFPVNPDEKLLNKERISLLAQIPTGTPVVATFRFLPKLANRHDLYSFHHIYSGKYTFSTLNYPTPESIRHLAIDTSDPLTFSRNGFYGSDNYKNIQALLSKGQWETLENIGPLLLLEKIAETPDMQPDVTFPVILETAVNTNIIQLQTSPLQLHGFRIIALENSRIIELTLFWKKMRPDLKDCEAKLTLNDEALLFSGIIVPGHRIWPPQSWSVTTGTNQVIADKHCIRLDRAITAPLKLRAEVALLTVN